MDSVVSGIDGLARWWTQASNEERWLLLRRSQDPKAPKGTPNPQQLLSAIILAETEAGEVVDETRAAGQG